MHEMFRVIFHSTPQASLSVPSYHVPTCDGCEVAKTKEREGGPGGDGESVSRDASVCKVPFGW